MENSPISRGAAAALIFLLLLLMCGGTPAAAEVITVPGDELGYGELGTYAGGNLSINISHFHRETVYHPIEIPLWFWTVIASAGILFLAVSFLWSGALNVTVISAWVALLFVELAQWTAFMIRDTVIHVDFLSLFDPANLNITIWSVVQPAAVATDYMILFWGMMPITVIAILNVIAVHLEMGKPGLNYFRAGVMRRPPQ